MGVNGSVVRSALIGAAHGAAECGLLFALSDKYTISKDWLLAVMVVVANASGFAVAGRYGVSLVGVAVAGLVGMMVGGWLGVRLIGSYEYTVPTPRVDRVMRIITKDGEREIELRGVPDETVRRIPVGGGLGVVLGWAVAAGAYAWLSRPRAEIVSNDSEGPDAEPPAAPERADGEQS